MKDRVCRCYDHYGESSEDCDWLFRPRHGRQIYCGPCGKIADRLRRRNHMRRKRSSLFDSNPEVYIDSASVRWEASWIDRECTHCGCKGVPTFNRYLCFECWTGVARNYDEYNVSAKSKLSRKTVCIKRIKEGNGEVKVYSADNYTQEELQAILNGG